MDHPIVFPIMILLSTAGASYFIAWSVRTRLVRAGNRYYRAWFIASFLFSFALMLTAVYLFLLQLSWGR